MRAPQFKQIATSGIKRGISLEGLKAVDNGSSSGDGINGKGGRAVADRARVCAISTAAVAATRMVTTAPLTEANVRGVKPKPAEPEATRETAVVDVGTGVALILKLTQNRRGRRLTNELRPWVYTVVATSLASRPTAVRMAAVAMSAAGPTPIQRLLSTLSLVT